MTRQTSSPQRLQIHQNLIQGRYPPLTVNIVWRSSDPLTSNFLQEFLKTDNSSVGISIAHSTSSSVAAIAFATNDRILIVEIGDIKKDGPRENLPAVELRVLEDYLLCLSGVTIYAFDVHFLASSLFLDLGLRLNRAVDLQSILSSKKRRPSSWETAILAFEEADLLKTNFDTIFEDESWNPRRPDNLVQRAWLCQLLGTADSIKSMILTVPRVDTLQWGDEELKILLSPLRNMQSVNLLKATSVTHEFAEEWTHKDGELILSSTRFQTRLRPSKHRSVRVNVASNDGFVLSGKITSTSGKKANLALEGELEGKQITSVVSLGREQMTEADNQKQLAVLHALQRKIPPPLDDPWIKLLWAGTSSEKEYSGYNNLSPSLSSPFENSESEYPESTPFVANGQSGLNNHEDEDNLASHWDHETSISTQQIALFPDQPELNTQSDESGRSSVKDFTGTDGSTAATSIEELESNSHTEDEDLWTSHWDLDASTGTQEGTILPNKSEKTQCDELDPLLVDDLTGAESSTATISVEEPHVGDPWDDNNACATTLANAGPEIDFTTQIINLNPEHRDERIQAYPDVEIKRTLSANAPAFVPSFLSASRSKPMLSSSTLSPNAPVFVPQLRFSMVDTPKEQDDAYNAFEDSVPQQDGDFLSPDDAWKIIQTEEEEWTWESNTTPLVNDPWAGSHTDAVNSTSDGVERYQEDPKILIHHEALSPDDPWFNADLDSVRATLEIQEYDAKLPSTDSWSQAQDIDSHVELTPKPENSILTPDDPWYSPELDGPPSIPINDATTPPEDPWSNLPLSSIETGSKMTDLRVERTTLRTKSLKVKVSSTKQALLPILPLKFSVALNDAQTLAAKEMLNHRKERDITLIQGPPGTGKTTVIAAFISSILHDKNRRVVITAHSNVAVKNIAEKLASYGIRKWKLIVSQDFHRDWHEHLYQKEIKGNIVLSTKVKPETFGGVNVVLCTLSMLCNPKLRSLKDIIALDTLIVDEASQIETGDYLPVISTYGCRLKKICFIGDNKQLPPFNSDFVKSIQSIFEKEHLYRHAIFLNIQYRIPPAIGDFISRHVYDGMLQTYHEHPVHGRDACKILGIEGKEEASQNSWKNEAEIRAVVSIVRSLSSQGLDFCVITPYDSQRHGIEQALQSHNLSWEGRVYNVDAFQGNERDHVVISTVRTAGVGFLQDIRRTNVMLTRCKKSMWICSNKSFLTTTGANTLIGKMAREWGIEEEPGQKEPRIDDDDGDDDDTIKFESGFDCHKL